MIAEPENAAAVAAALHAAAKNGHAVLLSGGKTLQSIGNAAARCDLEIDLRRVAGVEAYDPRDLTIGVGAGTTIAAVLATLGDHNQFVPFDVPHPSRATVGGTLAAGWAGPRRATYGRLRDLIIGSTAALTDGTLASGGGMVVKNVTGYDMSKLYVGSLGTLGAIVRANFKTLPKPAARRLALAPVPDESRDRAVAAIGALAVEPTAALVVHGYASALPDARGDSERIVLLFEGSSAVIDRATRDARSALGAAGLAETTLLDGALAERAFAGMIDAYVETIGNRSITYRASGTPATAWERARRAIALAGTHRHRIDSIADLRTGDVIARFTGASNASIGDDLASLDRDVRQLFVRSTILAGAPALRERLDAWGRVPTTIATMRALKARFDPDNILAPGRYVGGI